MLKLRLKRCGRTKKPFYRFVIMESKSKRDGYALEELGYYDPLAKILVFNKERTLKRLNEGAKPTLTVKNLLNKLNLV